VTSPEARRQSSADPDTIRTMGDAGGVAVERLNAALYGLRVGAGTDKVLADAAVSCAASLLRIAGAPARAGDDDDTVRRNVAALAASLAGAQDDMAALRATVERLVARVDALEDRP
jgi:hypothetical protein